MPPSSWLANPIFAAAGPIVCAELAARHPARIYPAGERIVIAGEPADAVYVLLAGSARAYCSRGEQELLLYLLQAPALFGDAEAMAETSWMAGLEVLTPVELALMEVDEYRGFLARHPRAAVAACQQLARMACTLQGQARLLLASAEERVAAALLVHARAHGRLEGGLVNPCLSQVRLARETGLCRRTVAEVVSRWRHRRILEPALGGLVVLDLPALLELAAAGQPLELAGRCSSLTS